MVHGVGLLLLGTLSQTPGREVAGGCSAGCLSASTFCQVHDKYGSRSE
jgi:hypothetical protein